MQGKQTSKYCNTGLSFTWPLLFEKNLNHGLGLSSLVKLHSNHFVVSTFAFQKKLQKLFGYKLQHEAQLFFKVIFVNS